MADGGSGISSSRLSSKKTFEYKMSKKVAELTQVVHMLFSRNHEREVELEATKDAYEREITNVIADAKKRIEALEQRLAEEQRKAEANAVSIENSYEKKLHEQKKGADKRFAEMKIASDKYISQISSLKGEISNLEKEVERTKQEALRTHFASSLKPKSPSLQGGQDTSQTPNSKQQNGDIPITQTPASSTGNSSAADAANVTALKEDVRKKELEIENLKKQAAVHAKTQRENDVAIGQFRRDFDRTESELRLRVAQLIDDVTRANKAREKMQLKNKALEMDLKTLKRSNERKKEAIDNSEANKQRVSAAISISSKSSESEIPSGAREEIERLRREIKRYRMELCNREGNFNRMFADSNPVRLGGMAVAPSLGMARQRTDVGVMPTVGVQSSRSDEGSPKPRSLPNRLPTLGFDGKQKDRDVSRSKLGFNSELGGGGRRSSVAKERPTPRGITNGYT